MRLLDKFFGSKMTYRKPKEPPYTALAPGQFGGDTRPTKKYKAPNYKGFKFGKGVGP